MNYREINFDILKDIDKKKKYIIIPIGTIEVHGPHLPFGTDLYIAEAFSNELEKIIDSIIMPSIYYSYSGTTSNIDGTISIDVNSVSDYLYNIIKSLIRSNFEKIIVINIHKDNDPIIKLALAKIFEEYVLPVLYINPYSDYSELSERVFSNKSNSHKETSILSASLKILNKKGLIGKIRLSDGLRTQKQKFVEKLLKIGYVKYGHTNEMQHIPPVEDASTDDGLIYIKEVIKIIASNIMYLQKYINYLKKTNQNG